MLIHLAWLIDRLLKVRLRCTTVLGRQTRNTSPLRFHRIYFVDHSRASAQIGVWRRRQGRDCEPSCAGCTSLALFHILGTIACTERIVAPWRPVNEGLTFL